MHSHWAIWNLTTLIFVDTTVLVSGLLSILNFATFILTGGQNPEATYRYRTIFLFEHLITMHDITKVRA